MAHLWTRDADDDWAVFPLDADAFSLGQEPPGPLADLAAGRDAAGLVALVRSAGDRGESWSLVVGEMRRVQINGLPLTLGLRVLRDRDEIRIDTVGRLYFSSERLPCVERFPGVDAAIYCPRCKAEVAQGSLAVKCPGCSVVHHEDESLGFRCWSYAETCALCPQPTSVREFCWSPRGL